MHFILKSLVHLLVIAGALLLIARFVPGIMLNGFYTACIVSLCWGLISLFIKPVLALLTLPINLITLGAFSLVLNAFLFWFLGSFVAGFNVAGFLPALEGSLLLSLVVWILHKVW